MRKVILTLLFSAFGLYAMGQQSGLVPDYQIHPVQIKSLSKSQAHPQGKTNSDGISQWYNLLDEAFNSGSETYTTYYADIFSDSTAREVYSNNGTVSSGYVTLQDVGEVFDPKYSGYDQPLSLYNTYNIDSVGLAYLYHYVPEKDTLSSDGLVHDTLIFQFYTVKTLGVDTGVYQGANANGDTEAWASVKYNYKTNLGIGSTGNITTAGVYKYVLGAKDSVTVIPTGTSQPFIVVPVINNSGTIGISVNDVINAKIKTGYNRDLFAYTVSYRPGFKWAVGDTLDVGGTATTVAHPHSYFRTFQGENASKDMTKDLHEMSLKVSSVANETNAQGVQTIYHGGNRYNNDPGWTLNGQVIYTAGTAWNDFDEVLYSVFYVDAPNTSAINQTPGDPKGFILGNIYPNPANGSANLNFALGNTEQVKITLYDMLGHEVAVLANGQYTQGQHTISFNTDNLKEGVYLYSINAGSFAKTLKFTVAHN